MASNTFLVKFYLLYLANYFLASKYVNSNAPSIFMNKSLFQLNFFNHFLPKSPRRYRLKQNLQIKKV